MKTLILFILYIALIECRVSPIEVYEIKETNDRHPKLYVRNVNDLEEIQGSEESPLSQILKPYKKQKPNLVEKVTKDLVEKLKKALNKKKNDKVRARDIYIIDGSLLQDDSSVSDDDEAIGDFRNEKSALQNLLSQLASQKQNLYQNPDRAALRSHYDDRTAAPMHRHEYGLDQ